MTNLFSDIRFGVRMLSKNPTVTIIALLALTLGIGANTAIFSVVNAVLLRSMPYGDAERLVLVWEKKQGADTDQNVINLANFFDWKEQNTVFSDMAAFVDATVNFSGTGTPEEIPAQYATTNLFSVLGTNALLGRTFTSDDLNEASPRAVVISYGLWQRRFGGDSQIIGQKIQLNNRENVIVGVLPQEFGWYIQKGSLTNKSAELWRPWQITNEMRAGTGRFASAVARMKPGVSVSQVQAEMDAIGSRLAAQRQSNTNWGVTVVPLRTQFTGDIRKPLLILVAAVGFVLLIACANIANLLLARASARRKEIALRVGLGASRLRIVRQLLTESLLLSIVGGSLGVLLALWGTRALILLSPPSLVGLQNVSVNLPVLGFTFGLALVTGIVFGLVPAIEATRIDLQSSLKEAGKNIGGSGGQRLRSTFAVVQIALALVLLVGAGLLVKSLWRLQSVDPGFNSSNLLTMRVSLPTRRYDTDAKLLDFFTRAHEQLKALPGVEGVGAINTLPFAGFHAGTNVHVEGTPVRQPGQELTTGVCVTDFDYFPTMQIPLRRGRLFTKQEATEMRHVVLVNEAFVRKNLSGEEPIGKRITIRMKQEDVPSEIIGVVGDHKHMGLDLEVKPMAYWPQPELVYAGMTFVVRTKSDPASITSAARGVIYGLDPLQPIGDVDTMEKLLSTSVVRSRFSATLLSVFSVVALLMALVGIYGVMSYSVVQRTHEIGVRIALGAQTRDVLRLVVMKGVVIGVIGVALGLAASFGFSRLMSSLLFGVTATDKATYAVVAIALFLITLVACYIPARRATRVDPLKALRYE